MLSLPLSDLDLSRLPALIAAAWGDENGLAGIARLHHVDPRKVEPVLMTDGSLCWQERHNPCGSMLNLDRSVSRALAALAEHLESLGYAIEWEGGACRVVGLACVRVTPAELAMRRRVYGSIATAEGLVEVRSLDATDPRRIAHDRALFDARLARRAPEPVDVGREQGIATVGGGVSGEEVGRWRSSLRKSSRA